MRLKFLAFILSLFYGSASLGYTHMNAKRLESEERGSTGYMFQLGISKPTFTDVEDYEDTYGTTNIFPSLSMTYKFLNFSVFSLGLGLKFSYYMANGRTLREVGGSTVPDKESSTTLKLVPYEIYAMGKISPFRQRYVVLDVWVGYEELYYEEVRLLQKAQTTTTTTSSSSTPKPKNRINSGWNKGINYGVSINFLMNPLDDQAAKALRSTTSLSFIYLGPYAEWSNKIGGGRLFISNQQSSAVDFSRVSYGVLFMFET